MTGEEMERTIAFILEQQAQITATMGRFIETVETLSHKVDRMADKIDRMADKVDRNAESATALLAIAEIHDRQMKETDERLSALINTVERHISEGRNGKA